MTTEQKLDVVIAMLEDTKEGKKQPPIDLSKVETLTVALQHAIDHTDNHSARLIEAISEARKPVICERRLTIDIVSKEAVFIFVGLVVVVAVLSAWLYWATRPNYNCIDNDLKYRYLKMKSEATPARLAELEELFEINRDEARIGKMRQDVEAYERAIRQKTALEEQTRLQQIETEKLDRKAQKLKEE